MTVRTLIAAVAFVALAIPGGVFAATGTVGGNFSEHAAPLLHRAQATPPQTWQRGDVPRDAVLLVQRQLADLGFDPGPADGLMGPRTRGAIRAVQRELGVPRDGRLTADLARQIDVLWRQRPSAAAAAPAPVEAGTPDFALFDGRVGFLIETSDRRLRPAFRNEELNERLARQTRFVENGAKLAMIAEQGTNVPDDILLSVYGGVLSLPDLPNVDLLKQRLAQRIYRAAPAEFERRVAVLNRAGAPALSVDELVNWVAENLTPRGFDRIAGGLSEFETLRLLAALREDLAADLDLVGLPEPDLPVRVFCAMRLGEYSFGSEAFELPLFYGCLNEQQMGPRAWRAVGIRSDLTSGEFVSTASVPELLPMPAAEAERLLLELEAFATRANLDERTVNTNRARGSLSHRAIVLAFDAELRAGHEDRRDGTRVIDVRLQQTGDFEVFAPSDLSRPFAVIPAVPAPEAPPPSAASDPGSSPYAPMLPRSDAESVAALSAGTIARDDPDALLTWDGPPLAWLADDGRIVETPTGPQIAIPAGVSRDRRVSLPQDQQLVWHHSMVAVLPTGVDDFAVSLPPALIDEPGIERVTILSELHAVRAVEGADPDRPAYVIALRPRYAAAFDRSGLMIGDLVALPRPAPRRLERLPMARGDQLAMHLAAGLRGQHGLDPELILSSFLFRSGIFGGDVFAMREAGADLAARLDDTAAGLPGEVWLTAKIDVEDYDFDRGAFPVRIDDLGPPSRREDLFGNTRLGAFNSGVTVELAEGDPWSAYEPLAIELPPAEAERLRADLESRSHRLRMKVRLREEVVVNDRAPDDADGLIEVPGTKPDDMQSLQIAFDIVGAEIVDDMAPLDLLIEPAVLHRYDIAEPDRAAPEARPAAPADDELPPDDYRLDPTFDVAGVKLGMAPAEASAIAAEAFPEATTGILTPAALPEPFTAGTVVHTPDGSGVALYHRPGVRNGRIFAIDRVTRFAVGQGPQAQVLVDLIEEKYGRFAASTSFSRRDGERVDLRVFLRGRKREGVVELRMELSRMAVKRGRGLSEIVRDGVPAAWWTTGDGGSPVQGAIDPVEFLYSIPEIARETVVAIIASDLSGNAIGLQTILLHAAPVLETVGSDPPAAETETAAPVPL